MKRLLTIAAALLLFLNVQAQDAKKELVLKQIDQNDIQTIQVLKDESAVQAFGESGKNGVIILGLKEGRLAPVLEYLKTKGVTATE
jgi:hypothetical protein